MTRNEAAERPRTAAGRLLLDAFFGEDGLPVDPGAVIAAIETEATFLRPRWHHDRSLSPEDRHFCEECDEQIRELAALKDALRRCAERFHGLTDEPPHQFHIFRDCPDDYCIEARTVLDAEHVR